MSESKTYVTTDDRGTMRVGSAGVMLDGIVHAFEQGDSPESIRQQYPGLTLEEVYGAITSYLNHRQRFCDTRDQVSRPIGDLCPGGTAESSPAIHRRAWRRCMK